MVQKDMFRKNMLRSYRENVFYNLFSYTDIEELEKVFKFAEGLVIKNDRLAEEFETDTSLRAANHYMHAVLDKELRREQRFTEAERRAIINGYSEANPYYIYLKTYYGIPPLAARRAEDYSILKATNKTLTVEEEADFYKAYEKMVRYFEQVTQTTAFDNQSMVHQYYEVYIIFGTILRFVNSRMDTYFDVDQYTRKELKNGFISWGNDYFDEVPLSYQRRIFKALNDLIRNKGTDNVIAIIDDLFPYQYITINKYILAKTYDFTKVDPNPELAMYRVPYQETLNPRNHEEISYESIVEDDPYWRSTEDEILQVNFNTIPTKYISADVTVDLTEGTKQLSYFVNLLNRGELLDRETYTKFLDTGQGSRLELQERYGLLDSDFSFLDSRISASKIPLFDSLIAMSLLVVQTMNLSDTIKQVKSLDRVYAYNYDKQPVDLLREIRYHLYRNKDDFPRDKWEEYMLYFSSFRLKDITRYEQVDIRDIITDYNSSATNQRQLEYLGDLLEDVTKSTKVLDYAESGNIYDAIETLLNICMDPRRGLDLDFLYQYTNLHGILADFVDYQVDTGMLAYEKLLDGFTSKPVLRKELEDLQYRIQDPDLTRMIQGYLNIPKKSLTHDRVDSFLQSFSRYLYTNQDQLRTHFLAQKNLYVYMVIFTHTEDPNMNQNKVSIRDFIDIYTYNEDLRETLETYIFQESDATLSKYMKQIWEQVFVGSFNMDSYQAEQTLSSYLMRYNPELYEYTRVELPVYEFEMSKRPLYRDKLFTLVETVDGYLNMTEDLFTQNNLIGITQFVRRYITILLQIFKAYTLQLLPTSLSYILGDRFTNSIQITDELRYLGTNLYETDNLDVQDTYIQKTKLPMGDETLKVQEKVKLTIKVPGSTDIVREVG